MPLLPRQVESVNQMAVLLFLVFQVLARIVATVVVKLRKVNKLTITQTND